MDGCYMTPVQTKANTTNPKDLLGVKKVPLTIIPPIASALEAEAMLDGQKKYGPYNWRSKKVRARIYIDACMRHLAAWLEGQEYAEDSGCHHLGHARACLGILLDAQNIGHLIDDRPILSELSEANTTSAYLNGLKIIHDRIKEKL